VLKMFTEVVFHNVPVMMDTMTLVKLYVLPVHVNVLLVLVKLTVPLVSLDTFLMTQVCVNANMEVLKMDVVVVLVYLDVKIVKVMLLTVLYVLKAELMIHHLVHVHQDHLKKMVNVITVIIVVQNV